MPDLIPIDDQARREVANFNPDTAGQVDAALTAAIAYAKKIRDWTALDEAVDAQIEHQKQIVGWWRRNVTVRHGGDTNNAVTGGVDPHIDGEAYAGEDKGSRRSPELV